MRPPLLRCEEVSCDVRLGNNNYNEAAVWITRVLKSTENKEITFITKGNKLFYAACVAFHYLGWVTSGT